MVAVSRLMRCLSQRVTAARIAYLRHDGVIRYEHTTTCMIRSHDTPTHISQRKHELQSRVALSAHINVPRCGTFRLLELTGKKLILTNQFRAGNFVQMFARGHTRTLISILAHCFTQTYIFSRKTNAVDMITYAYLYISQGTSVGACAQH